MYAFVDQTVLQEIGGSLNKNFDNLQLGIKNSIEFCLRITQEELQ